MECIAQEIEGAESGCQFRIGFFFFLQVPDLRSDTM